MPRPATGKFVLHGILTCNATSAVASITGNLDLDGDQRGFHVNDGTAAIDLDISAVISNGALAKTNAGTLRLDGSLANTYTGQTLVNGGTLELAKSGGVAAISNNLDIFTGVVRQILGNQFLANTSIVVEVGTELDLNGLPASVAVVSVFPNALLTTGGAGVGHLTAAVIGTETDSTLAMKLAGTANSDQLTIGSVLIHGALSLNPTQRSRGRRGDHAR